MTLLLRLTPIFLCICVDMRLSLSEKAWWGAAAPSVFALTFSPFFKISAIACFDPKAFGCLVVNRCACVTKLLPFEYRIYIIFDIELTNQATMSVAGRRRTISSTTWDLKGQHETAVQVPIV